MRNMEEIFADLHNLIEKLDEMKLTRMDDIVLGDASIVAEMNNLLDNTVSLTSEQIKEMQLGKIPANLIERRIDDIEIIRQRAARLRDEVREIERSGEYYPDEIRQFNDDYYALDDRLFSVSLALGRISTVKSESYRETQRQLLEARRIRDRQRDTLSSLRDEESRINRDRANFQREISELEGQLERLGGADVDGLIAERVYDDQIIQIQGAIATLRRRIEALDSRVPQVNDEVSRAEEALAQAEQRVNDLNDIVRREREEQEIAERIRRERQARNTEVPSRSGDQPSNGTPSSSSNDTPSEGLGNTSSTGTPVGGGSGSSSRDNGSGSPVGGSSNGDQPSEEPEEQVLFEDYVPERAIYESRGMTQREYMIFIFEQRTHIKFDPDIHEIRENHDAYSDGYDAPVSTFSVILKRVRKEKEEFDFDIEERPIFEDYVPERAIYESRGMTQREYMIFIFEQRTHTKFDPAIHEIRENHDAYSDGFDNPISTFTVIEKVKVRKRVITGVGKQGPGTNPNKPKDDPEKGTGSPTGGLGNPDGGSQKPGDDPEKGKGKPNGDPQPEEFDGGIDPTELDDNVREINRDMLQKFWGDRKKHRQYTAAIKRIHDAIVPVNPDDPDGQLTIREYEGLEDDLRFCRIEEFKERLERFSRKDDSAYEELYDTILCFYPEIIPLAPNGRPLTKDEFVTLKRMEDEIYISTNNQAYDKHKATAENIKTLGKHGEKKAYMLYQKLDQLEGSQKAKAIIGNVVKAGLNTMIFIRNHTRVSLSKLIGTYVAAPIHKVLMGSRYSSPYRDDRTHRYEERKAYYEAVFDEQYAERLAEKNARREARGLQVSEPSGVGKVFRKAFGPRLQAMFKCKDGNMMVLASKGNANREAERARLAEVKKKKEIFASCSSNKEKFENELTEVNEQLAGDISPEEREKLEAKKAELIASIEECDRGIAYALSTSGRKANDAISMESHDKANKENITKAVTGLALLAKIIAARFVFPKIKEKITEFITDVQTTPGHWDITTVDQMTEESVKKITVGDIMDKSDSTRDLQYDVWGIVDRHHGPVSPEIPRGFKITWEGHDYSISDIAPISSTGIPRTSSGFYDIDRNTNLMQLICDTISRGGGPTITPDQLAHTLVTEPSKFVDLANSAFGWLSYTDSGVPMGWVTWSEAIKELAKEPIIIRKWIAGEVITTTTEVTKEVIHGGWAALFAAISASALADINEIARRTQSRAEVERELRKHIERKAYYEIESKYPPGPERDAAKAALDLKIAEEVEKIISANARPRRDYRNADFTNTYGFTGGRSDLTDSSYDENAFAEEPSKGR